MAKPCNSDGCFNPRFSGGFCKWHGYMREPKNKSSNKFSQPAIKKEYKGVNDLSVDKEVEMYKILWENREHESFLSGLPINIREGSSFWYNIFAHILAKGQAKYPKFRLYSENIIFLTPEEHLLLDHCAKEQRDKYAEKYNCDWSVVYDLQEKLKKEYAILFS
tara:strand:- start:12236 stop:12724 length:489 start_codon:yes stop_codon:yes gene_type:complete